MEENCPKECWKEQDAWIECLVIELDCDWRCPGSAWLGARGVGMDGMNNGAAALGMTRGRTRVVWWILLTAFSGGLTV